MNQKDAPLTKGIDDTWEYVSGGWPYDVYRKGTNQKIADVWGDACEDTHQVADMIAAAPEMARLLLELEWISQETDEGALQPQCMICEVRHEWDWRSQSWTNTHAPDCRWAAVLRKAGVLPTP